MVTKINNNLAKPDHINVVAKLFKNGFAFDKTGYTEIKVHDVSNVFKINRDNINQTTVLMYGQLSTTPIAKTILVNDNNIYNLLFLESDKYISDWIFDYSNNIYTTTINPLTGYIWKNNTTTTKKILIKPKALFDFNKIDFILQATNETDIVDIVYDDWNEILVEPDKKLGFVLTTTVANTYNIFNQKGKPNGIKFEYKIYDV